MSTHEIRACVDAFVADLSSLVQQAALEAVESALMAGAPSTPRRAAPGKPRPPVRVFSAARPKRTKPVARSVRGKRDPRALEALVEKLHAYIVADPAQRIEHISVALGVSTKELAPAIKALLAAERITRTGQARSTSYSGAFAPSAVPAMPAASAASAVSTVSSSTGERLVRVTPKRKAVGAASPTDAVASK